MATKDRFTMMTINGRQERVLCEEDYRKKLLIVARTLGCEKDWLICLDKYDRLLRNCHNQSEVQAIQAIGIKELSDILDTGYVGVGGEVFIVNQKENKQSTIIDDTKTRRDGGIII